MKNKLADMSETNGSVVNGLKSEIDVVTNMGFALLLKIEDCSQCVDKMETFITEHHADEKMVGVGTPGSIPNLFNTLVAEYDSELDFMVDMIKKYAVRFEQVCKKIEQEEGKISPTDTITTYIVDLSSNKAVVEFDLNQFMIKAENYMTRLSTYTQSNRIIKTESVLKHIQDKHKIVFAAIEQNKMKLQSAAEVLKRIEQIILDFDKKHKPWF